MPKTVFTTLLILILLFPAAAASTNSGPAGQERVALVIGNSAYDPDPLKTPVNDAQDMADVLESLGFEVILRLDADQKSITKAIRDFARLIPSARVALFYFAGYGLQMDGRNFLLPIGCRLRDKSDVEFDGLDVTRVLEKMDAPGNRINMVILDACRDIPFVRGIPSLKSGLAPLPAPQGTILAYANSPDRTVPDEPGRNSVYTKALKSRLLEPGLTVFQIFKMIRRQVAKTTQGRQTPWESSSLSADFSFQSPAAASRPAPSPPPPAKVASPAPPPPPPAKSPDSPRSAGKKVAMPKPAPQPEPAPAPAPPPPPPAPPTGGSGPTGNKDATVAITLPPDSEKAVPISVTPPSEGQAAPDQTVIHRYPTLETPEEVFPGHEFAAQVSLTEDLITPEVKVKTGQVDEEGRLVLKLPQGQESWDLKVIMTAPGFNFKDGRNIAALTLPRQGDSTPAVFYLTPKPGINRDRPALLFVTLWHQGVFLAKIAREVTVAESSEAGAEKPAASAAPAAGPAATAAPEPPPASLDFNLKQPDLTLYILEKIDPANPGQAQIIINSPYLQPSVHYFNQAQGLSDWLKAQYLKFMQTQTRGMAVVPKRSTEGEYPSGKETLATLTGFGRQLYRQFAPPAFKEAFWKLVDRLGPDFKTIQIFTDNPGLPWELMRPCRADGSDERDFLGVEFEVGRWHVGRSTSQLDRPPQTMPIKDFVVIAPEYNSEVELPGQKIEIEALSSLKEYRRLPGRIENLEKLIGDLPQGIVHFAGHGRVSPSAQFVISLEDSDLDLMTWQGMTPARPSRNHPFFFMNACDVGQAVKIADFVSGWAPAVLEAGGSGFIGSLWPLDDQSAALFAARFYELLNQGLEKGPVNLPDILKETRRLFLNQGDPAFLAYIYYGDPNFQLFRAPAGRN